MRQEFFDKIQQTSTSWLVRGVYVFIVALLFILPLYDLFTGNMAYSVWTMLIVATIVLIFEYIVIYFTGKWNDGKQLMEIPVSSIVWIVLLMLACCVAFFLDFFIHSILHPYLIPVLIAIIGSIIFLIHERYNHIKSTKIDKVK
jgi:hypothetical protein